jgi:hypothetical protein
MKIFHSRKNSPLCRSGRRFCGFPNLPAISLLRSSTLTRRIRNERNCAFDKESIRLIFDLINRRYNKEGSFNMIFTSNKNPALWREYFDEDATLLCTLDRILTMPRCSISEVKASAERDWRQFPYRRVRSELSSQWQQGKNKFNKPICVVWFSLLLQNWQFDLIP